MKIAVVFALILELCGSLFANPLINEGPFMSVGTAGKVEVSTWVWTAVPSTTSVTAGRMGIFVTNGSTNPMNMRGIVSNDPLVPTASTTTESYCFLPGSTEFMRISDSLYLYVVSTGTTLGSSIYYQEYKN